MKYVAPLSEAENASYKNFSPQHGIDGSKVSAEAVEHPQREVVAAIAALGLKPNGDELDQLAKGLFNTFAVKDFNAWPMDEVINLMKKLRVPIWLNKNTTWYVDASNGSDDNDGSLPSKAFKTIQYAVNYVSENFELGIYTATIQAGAGTFNEDVILPKYSASTGIMRIVGAGKNATIICGAYFGLPGASRWGISDQTIRFSGRGSPHTVDYLYDGIRMLGGSEAYLSNVLFDLGSSNGSGAVTIRLAARSVGGNIIFFTGCSFAGSGPGSSAFLAAQQSGNIQINGDTDFNGEVSVATLMVQTGGGFTFDTGTIGRVPVLSGTVSGPRAVCFLNGIIYTMGSGGQAAFPGTINGGVSTGGQIV